MREFSIKNCLTTGLCLATLVSCAHLNYEKKQGKEFRVESMAIRKIGPTENLSHRKISRSAPLLIGDSIIVASSNDGIGKFKKSNLKKEWFFPVVGGVETSPAIYNKNRLIFGGKDGSLYSLDVNTGKLIWKFFASAEILSDPVLVNGDLYSLAGNNVLFKLDADTGERKWVYSRVQNSSLSIRGGSSPLVLNRRLYLGFSDGFLVALDTEKGNLIWERKLGNLAGFSDVDSSPVTDGKSLFVSSYDGSLYSILASTGEVQWKSEDGGYSTPVISGVRLFYPTSKGEIQVLDTTSGKKLWSYQVNKGIASSPLIFNNMFVVSTSGGSTLFFDLNSLEYLGKYEPGKGSLAAPVWDEEKHNLYLNSNAGYLHKLKLSWKDPRLDWAWEK